MSVDFRDAMTAAHRKPAGDAPGRPGLPSRQPLPWWRRSRCEAARRVLIDAHVSAWNRVEALRQFERCRAILMDELGLLPGDELAAAAARDHGPAAVTQASRQVLSSMAPDSTHAS